jgi:Mn-dependent DtxR family transcriptional regulator
MDEKKEQYLHIPSYILSDVRLDSTQQILLSEILNLSKTQKGCYASNMYFGELLNINPDGASKQISKIKNLGYIETKRFYKNHNLKRLIKILEIPITENESKLYINIPYSVLFDIKLTSIQKILLSEIIALNKLPDGCIKSNREFGEILNVCTSGIYKQIKKLVEMGYIITNNDTRKIELSSSYITNSFFPKSQNGYSYITNSFVPSSQNGCSHRNTINTVNNSVEILPVLAQYTSTEIFNEKSEIEILEEKIIISCEQGNELLEEIKEGNFNNYWKYTQQKQTREYVIQLIKEYKSARINFEINNSSTKIVSETNGVLSPSDFPTPPAGLIPLPNLLNNRHASPDLI